MEHVFAPAAPYLRWSEMETSSQIDEQKGYNRLYSGAMLGIRNPTTHEFGWIDEPELALELIVFAQHLLRKSKRAERSEEHTSELQSLMRISYAVFCLKQKTRKPNMTVLLHS